VIYFELTILVISLNRQGIVIVIDVSFIIEARPCISEVLCLNLVVKNAFCFCSTRWCRRRTNARFPRGNTAHETNRVSPEHIEFIGLLYYDKSHVPCTGVCKEWGFTSLPQEKKRSGDVR